MTSVEPSTEILRITNPLIADGICRASLYSDSKYHILALVLSNSDVILWKVTAENTKHVMKWIPWKNDPDSKIQAIAFQPPTLESVSEHRINLLIITHDATLHSISVDEVIIGESSTQKAVKHSLFPNSSIPHFLPTALVWWNSSHRIHKNIAIIGGDSGQLVFYSLTQACYLAILKTGTKTPIFTLSICSDFFRDFSYLVITNDLRQQWKLLLEKEVNGEHIILVLFEGIEIKIEKNVEVPKSQKSRLQEFKQMSVETFTLLKQKLHDTKKVNVEKPKPGISATEYSELEACDCYGDAFLSVQSYKNRRVLSGLFIPESVLMLFLQNKESNVLLNYKLQISPLVTTLLLSNSFVYVADIMENRHRILVFSARISESKKSENMEYNPASFVQCFLFPEDEQILFLFLTNVKLSLNEKVLDAALPVNPESSSSSQARSKVKQMQIEEDWSEACLVVTNKGVYVISLRHNPLNLALESFKTDISIIKKLPFIFNLPLSKIIEYVSEELVGEKNVNDAVDLCNNFRCYSGKMTLKLANFGFINELLEHTEYLLDQNDLDLPHVERIHLSNFIVSCYAEKYLRNPSDAVLEQRFRKFLKENRYFDEEANVYILGNYRLCSFLHFLCVWRGLYVDTTVSLTNMIAQNQFDHCNMLHRFDGFWELFSENLLVDAFVLSPRTVHLHIDYLRENFVELSPRISKRLYHFYNPTQSVLKPAMNRMLHVSKEEYFDAYDIENDKWGCDANMFDWISNFLYLHLHLFKEAGYDSSLSKYVVQSLDSSIVRFSKPSIAPSESPRSMSSPVLSAGFAHAALVRDGCLVTWGQSTQGCLGSGPTLSPNCAPLLNSWFDDHRIRVKSVSCGRHHTLALTENGVYAWGSSKFGQLGVGHLGQSVHPRLVETLANNVIVSIAAGQYHSMAVDIDGRLWTWGWGVYGQLGHGDTEDQYYPKFVEKLKKKIITNACGGQAHSVVLTIKGKVFTFGCNAYGQLGTATNIKSSSPVKVFGLQENVVMIATNYFHNLALSYSNRLYTWGCSPQILKLQAQSLKRSKSMMNADRNPNDLVVNLDKYNNIDLVTSSAANSTEAANAVLEPDPEVIDYGKHLTPALVDTSHVDGNIMQVSCGLFHSALLTTDGQIYTWGRNTDGQLGNCKRQTLEVQVPTWVHITPTKYMPSNRENAAVLNQPLWRVSCGKDFTLVAELEGRIFGWGNNNSRQLGSPPVEDFSIRRFLNGKLVVNKYAKRLIKLPNSGINIVEKPIEISSIPKLQYLFTHNGNCPDRYLRMERNVDLPGLSYPQYSIESIDRLRSLNVSQNQILHYYLECFHEYYNAEFILRMAAEIGNFQAVAKICCLNYRFYEAFFYELKSLLSYARGNCGISSFKDDGAAAQNSLVTREAENRDSAEDYSQNDPVESANFRSVEGVVTEAVSILKYYCEMTLKFTSRKIESFLRKSISTWIVWELPIKPLEEFFSLHLDTIAYHLAVFLFCNGHKAPNPSNRPEVSNSSHISSALRESKLCSPSSSDQKSNSLSTKAVKYPFMNNDETKACYRNLYQRELAVNLESADARYRLKPEEILSNLSVQFLLQLCSVVVDSVSSKSPSEYEEFIRLMHEIIFAPSVLKSDDRSADEILSSVLNTLQRSESAPKKFIQISYQELQDRVIEDKFIAFSCRHFFTSQKDLEKEVRTVIQKLDGFRLLNTSEFVNRLYSNSTFGTCCPNCLFRCIQGEISVSNSTKT